VAGAETLAPKWKADAQARTAELVPFVRDLRAKFAKELRRQRRRAASAHGA
jgi:hypothetical protein